MSGVHVMTPGEEPSGAGQAAGFEDLEAEAAQLEGGAPPPGSPQAAVVEADQLQKLAGDLLQVLQLARVTVAPVFRWWADFGQVWGDPTLQGIANGGAAVMQRHGLSMGEVLTRWAPYIALGTATVPPVIVTYQAVKAKAAELEAQRQGKPKEGADVSDGQATH